MKAVQIILLFGILIATKPIMAQPIEEYYFNKVLEGNLEEITQNLKEELKKQEFGVITEIDMHTTLNEKLPDVELKPYKILGVCNPAFAYKAIQIEENIGLFLPCKAIVKDLGNGNIEIVIVDPVAIMSMFGSEELEGIAAEVAEKFKSALNNL